MRKGLKVAAILGVALAIGVGYIGNIERTDKGFVIIDLEEYKERETKEYSLQSSEDEVDIFQDLKVKETSELIWVPISEEVSEFQNSIEDIEIEIKRTMYTLLSNRYK